MRIAVIGATGMLGQPVMQELIGASRDGLAYSLRIIARDVVKAKSLFPAMEVVPGDLQRVESLYDSLRGVDVVYLNLSIKQAEKPTDFHTEAQGLRNLIEAAKRAKVGRIAYLSSLVMRYQGMNGFHWWVFDVKNEAIRLLKASGIPYSIFYPSCFMDSVNNTQRLGRFVLLVGRSAVRPRYISSHDYGRQLARALQIAEAGQHQEYVIQGPEAITQQEAAERFVAAYRKEKLSILTTPPFLMKLGRRFFAQADYGWHITEALNNYPETFDSETTWSDLGNPETTIEQFASNVQ